MSSTKKRLNKIRMIRMSWVFVGLLIVSCVIPASTASEPWWRFEPAPRNRLYNFPEAKPKKAFSTAAAMVQLSDYYYVAVAYGLEDEAKRTGVKLTRILSAGGYDKLDRQVKQIEDLIVSDVDVILLFAISEEGTASVVDRAVAAGKKVVTFVSGTKSPKVYANILEDYSGAGVRQAEYHCTRLGTKGAKKIAMLNGPAGAQWAMEMHDGFVTTIKERCPNVVIVAERWSPLTPGDALTIAEDFLTRYPDLDGMYTVYEIMARGAAPAVKRVRARNPNFVFTTQGLSPWGRDALTAGEIDMTAASLAILQGRWAIQAAVRAMSGEPAPGNADPLRTPTPTVTRDTVKTYDLSFAFYPEGYKIR